MRASLAALEQRTAALVAGLKGVVATHNDFAEESGKWEGVLGRAEGQMVQDESRMDE